MTISLELLTTQARVGGFRAEMLEKALRLLQLLSALMEQSFLKDKLVLKGGTALNLFYFGLPRLSIDIDLNYTGAIERAEMLVERKKIETLLAGLFQREGYTIRRSPTEHAGGKLSLRYNSALGQTAQLEVDLNYMLRVPLWPAVYKDSISIDSFQAKAIPTLDIHELMAGKLSALFARHASRDLFDAHYFFKYYNQVIDKERLRLAFIVYGAANRIDWRTISVENIAFTENELKNQLAPVLSHGFIQKTSSLNSWASTAISECHEAINNYLLPLKKHELEFLEQINSYGQIRPELLTNDNDLISKIKMHPALLWKAYNVIKLKD